jgi:predicted lipoprotein with Yx(FWY)xxD motif
MKRNLMLVILLLVSLALIAGCGDDDSSDGGGAEPNAAASEEAAMKNDKAAEEAAMKEEEAAMKKEEAAEGAAMKKGSGPEIVATDSEFGRILVDSEDQAIYIFENDEPGTSNCSGECAAAWPPVLTKDAGVAGNGVAGSLLGTTKRDDGTTQVTYDDKPLYYYAHEGPGQVLCHNVNLNGGFWWVIGPDGERRP